MVQKDGTKGRYSFLYSLLLIYNIVVCSDTDSEGKETILALEGAFAELHQYITQIIRSIKQRIRQ